MARLDQVARLLELPPYLRSHPDIPIAELATAFGVTPETMFKDLNLLSRTGFATTNFGGMVDIDFDALEQGRVVLVDPQSLRRPLRFNGVEAIGLIVALRSIADLTDVATRDRITGIIAKLTDAIDGPLAEQVSVTVATGSDEVVSALRDAILNRRQLQLTYDGEARGATTTPVVDPVRIELIEGSTYLRGYSVTSGAWRNYKLSRIALAVPTGAPVADHGTVPGAITSWLDEFAGYSDVRLELDPRAGWVTEYYPVRETAHTEAGTLLLDLSVSDPRWLARLLLRLGDQVIALTPAAALQSARRAATETLELLAEYAPSSDG